MEPPFEVQGVRGSGHLTEASGPNGARPQLTLEKFRGELRKEFGVDPQRQYRHDWRAVTLPRTGPPGREVTYLDWRNLESEYCLRRQHDERVVILLSFLQSST